MLYTYKGSNSFYFSHIPRTGGRHVHKLFMSNKCTLQDRDKANKFLYQEEFMHLTLKTARKFYKEDLPKHKLSIVRDPISRFNSCLKILSRMERYKIFFGDRDLEKSLEDYNNFINGMENIDYKVGDISFRGLKNFPNNWFKSQVQFIDSDTHLWKYEEGFNEDFFDFVEKSTNVKIVKVSDREHSFLPVNFDKERKINLSEKAMINIIRYYNEDYNLWKNLK